MEHELPGFNEMLAGMTDRVSTALQKRIEVINSVMANAKKVADYAKELPKDKHHKNIFIKSYIRRPRNKQRRSKAMMGMAVSSAISAMQVLTIMQQPSPSFVKGGTL